MGEEGGGDATDLNFLTKQLCPRYWHRRRSFMRTAIFITLMATASCQSPTFNGSGLGQSTSMPTPSWESFSASLHQDESTLSGSLSSTLGDLKTQHTSSAIHSTAQFLSTLFVTSPILTMPNSTTFKTSTHLSNATLFGPSSTQALKTVNSSATTVVAVTTNSTALSAHPSLVTSQPSTSVFSSNALFSSSRQSSSLLSFTPIRPSTSLHSPLSSLNRTNSSIGIPPLILTMPTGSVIVRTSPLIITPSGMSTEAPGYYMSLTDQIVFISADISKASAIMTSSINSTIVGRGEAGNESGFKLWMIIALAVGAIIIICLILLIIFKIAKWSKDHGDYDIWNNDIELQPMTARNSEVLT